LVEREGGPVLAGVSTFDERFGGCFGDEGGGVRDGRATRQAVLEAVASATTPERRALVEKRGIRGQEPMTTETKKPNRVLGSD
jgi:hypothetical protein